MGDSQTIIVTGGGAENTKPLTVQEKNGKDISAFPIYLGLSSDYDTPPASWDIASEQVSSKNYIRVVQHLVTVAVAVGDYWLWIKIVSSPETIIRRVAQIYVK